jgi:hypothetical protein
MRNDGILPRSIMIVGNAIEFKEFLKAKFEIIKFQTLILDGGATIRSAWVLPCSAQTNETSTLAKYLKSLGVQITEVDLDVESDEDEEDEAGHPLVDDEAQEAVDEDEDDDL